MPTRWGIGDGSVALKGKVVLSASQPNKGCSPDNDCGCHAPSFCNKWILYFLQVCESGGGQDGQTDVSFDGSDSYTMVGTIFVDLSSIPIMVVNPPPQSVVWQSKFGGTARHVSIPGLETGSFTLGDSDHCPLLPSVVDPFTYGCQQRRVLSSSGGPGAPPDCTAIDLLASQFLCDAQAVQNVVTNAGTSVFVPATVVDTPSDGQHLNAISTLFVGDATTFPSSGNVSISDGTFIIANATYSGKTGTSLTGFVCGSVSVVHTGYPVSLVFHLSDSTILVAGTTGSPSSGTFFVNVGGSNWETINYTGTTATSYTGCTSADGGTLAVNGMLIYVETSGSIDPTCPNPAPSGGIAVQFFYDYRRVSGADCHKSEAELIALYSPY